MSKETHRAVQERLVECFKRAGFKALTEVFHDRFEPTISNQFRHDYILPEEYLAYSVQRFTRIDVVAWKNPWNIDFAVEVSYTSDLRSDAERLSSVKARYRIIVPIGFTKEGKIDDIHVIPVEKIEKWLYDRLAKDTVGSSK